MKNIAVFGSYNGTSIGDTAILLGLLESLHRVAGNSIRVTVFTMGEVDIAEEIAACGLELTVREINVRIARRKESSTLARIITGVLSRVRTKIFGQSTIDVDLLKRELRKQDAMLIGGGNLIMDLYPQWPQLLNTVCRSADAAGVPYSFVGVGAGPISGGAELLASCVAGAAHTYFRDAASNGCCVDALGFRSGLVAPDLALGLTHSGPATACAPREGIAVNVASVFSRSWPHPDATKFEKYIDGMCQLVSRAATERGVRRIMVFNTNYPLDDLGSAAFVDRLSVINSSLEITYLDGRLAVAEITRVCSLARLAIVTRLHAAILAKLAGAEVVAIAYQPKVSDVLKEIDADVCVIPIEEVIKNGASDSSVACRSGGDTKAKARHDFPARIDAMLLGCLQNFDRA